MARDLDLAVLTQDPWLGGGALRQLEAFLDAARAAGREPRTFYLSREHALTPRRPLGWRGLRPRVPDGRPYRGVVPELEPLNQLAGLRMAPALRHARSVWVVATTAYFGLPALRVPRPYGCWIGTSFADEWQGRLAGGVSRARRLTGLATAPALRHAELRVLRGAERVYATSPGSQAQVARAGRLSSDAVGLIPLPVDVGRFTPEEDDVWLARLDAPVIAFVGRADDPRKNVPLLLEGFAQLRAERPGARLRLIGRPPSGAVPPGVELIRDPPSVAEALRTCSLSVLPSHQEGFGIVVAEALACGVPAIVTAGGPTALVQDSGGGVVLPSWQPGGLAETMRALLADPARLLELRRRGRAYVEREHATARVHGLVAAAIEELDAA